MIRKLETEVQSSAQCTFLKLSGSIDEDSELFQLLEQLPSGAVIIDLAAVEEINSCGVRDWVRWREELQARGCILVLVECSPAVVDKLNTVGNFNEGGFIKSFYIPYHCPACDTEKAMLVDIDEMRGEAERRIPICRCDTCDSIMVFDDLEGSYLAFLGDESEAKPPDAIREILERFSTGEGERKVVSLQPWGGSSFSGLSSRAASSDPSPAAGTGSFSSLASFRRLKERAQRRTAVGAPGKLARSAIGRTLWLMLLGSIVLLLVAILLALRL